MSQLGHSKSEDAPCRSCTSFSEYMKKSKKQFMSNLSSKGVRLLDLGVILMFCLYFILL